MRAKVIYYFEFRGDFTKKILKKMREYLFLVRINEAFLSVPFVVTAAFMVSDGIPDLKKLGALLMAVSGGFMAGNAFNAIADKSLDEKNPRTKDRPLASGNLTLIDVYIAFGISVVIVIISTIMINWKYLFLLPIPLVFCLGYSISKRYTYLCHLILGITNAICPVASWIIFSGWNDCNLVLMGGFVCFWTMGFELIYSSQDVEYDKESNMKSIPVAFGLEFTYRLAAVCHIFMFVFMSLLIYFMNLGFIFMLGIFITSPIIVYQHILIKNNKTTNFKLAFGLNQIYSIIIMCFAILENIC